MDDGAVGVEKLYFAFSFKQQQQQETGDESRV
jgi:hypothetical protein